MNLTGMRTFDPTETVDAVVIGTGAGGAPLLAQLARAGLRVVALEAGPNFDLDDLTPDETEAAKINWMSERISGGDHPTAFGPNNSGRGVGGSTLHWGAFCPRPDPRDLRLRSTTGEGMDWPVDAHELADYVRRAETDIGVSGPADYPWDEHRVYEQPPVARNASAQLVAAACGRLGIRATDAPAAVLSLDRHQADFGIRRGCVNCGACHQGCRFTAKSGMDNTYLPAAVAAGAEIRADSLVTGIQLDGRGRVASVTYSSGGRETRQRCDNVFLCAGGVETPRLLLHTDVATGSGMVGRNFLAHGAVQLWGQFDEATRSYRGYPSAIISEDFVRPPDADFAGGYLIQSLGVMPATYATSLVRGGGLWGSDLIEALDQYPFAAGIGINGECLPADGNKLELSDERDEFGIPLARITFTAGLNEQAIDQHATAVLRRILTEAGATQIRVLARTAHTLGTCRMSEDAGLGVVDPDLRSHEVPNLWICDNSVFPSALSANPGLTTMALSLRTADRFLRAG